MKGTTGGNVQHKQGFHGFRRIFTGKGWSVEQKIGTIIAHRAVFTHVTAGAAHVVVRSDSPNVCRTTTGLARNGVEEESVGNGPKILKSLVIRHGRTCLKRVVVVCVAAIRQSFGSHLFVF